MEKHYLKDIYSILSSYKTITKSHCEQFENPAKKEGKLKEWEDEYCAILKGKVGWGPVNIAWTCNTWSVEGGEGGVGELELAFANDGSFEAFTVGVGFGAGLDFGGNKIMALEGGASVKEFIKIGPSKNSGKWEVKDWGVKAESTLEASIGPVATEIKILEYNGSVYAGFEAGGVLAPVINIKQ